MTSRVADDGHRRKDEGRRAHSHEERNHTHRLDRTPPTVRGKHAPRLPSCRLGPGGVA
ncbi:MAG: hypothetical protein ACR2LX_08940 [Jatrophihabitans sp.]